MSTPIAEDPWRRTFRDVSSDEEEENDDENEQDGNDHHQQTNSFTHSSSKFTSFSSNFDPADLDLSLREDYAVFQPTPFTLSKLRAKQRETAAAARRAAISAANEDFQNTFPGTYSAIESGSGGDGSVKRRGIIVLAADLVPRCKLSHGQRRGGREFVDEEEEEGGVHGDGKVEEGEGKRKAMGDKMTLVKKQWKSNDVWKDASGRAIPDNLDEFAEVALRPSSKSRTGGELAKPKAKSHIISLSASTSTNVKTKTDLKTISKSKTKAQPKIAAQVKKTGKQAQNEKRTSSALKNAKKSITESNSNKIEFGRIPSNAKPSKEFPILESLERLKKLPLKSSHYRTKYIPTGNRYNSLPDDEDGKDEIQVVEIDDLVDGFQAKFKAKAQSSVAVADDSAVNSEVGKAVRCEKGKMKQIEDHADPIVFDNHTKDNDRTLIISHAISKDEPELIKTDDTLSSFPFPLTPSSPHVPPIVATSTLSPSSSPPQSHFRPFLHTNKIYQLTSHRHHFIGGIQALPAREVAEQNQKLTKTSDLSAHTAPTLGDGTHQSDPHSSSTLHLYHRSSSPQHTSSAKRSASPVINDSTVKQPAIDQSFQLSKYGKPFRLPTKLFDKAVPPRTYTHQHQTYTNYSATQNDSSVNYATNRKTNSSYISNHSSNHYRLAHQHASAPTILSPAPVHAKLTLWAPTSLKPPRWTNDNLYSKSKANTTSQIRSSSRGSATAPAYIPRGMIALYEAQAEGSSIGGDGEWETDNHSNFTSMPNQQISQPRVHHEEESDDWTKAWMHKKHTVD